MADVACLDLWEFVEESLNTCTRRRRGILLLTDDTILANGVFANVAPGLDAGTVRMHQLWVDRSTGGTRERQLSLLFFPSKRFRTILKNGFKSKS